jgi:protein TonB
MNLALSHRPDRHPVGLVVVVGLHALLAAVLVSAKLANRPAEPQAIALTPLDPVKPVVKEPQKLPDPPKPHWDTQRVVPPEIIKTEPPPPDVLPSRDDDHAKRNDGVVASADRRDGDDTLHKIVRVLARAARIDAGAAQCRPEYPAAAQRAGATGVTRIRFSVDASGRIAGAQIVQASGSSRENRLMDKAAAEALAQCPVQVGTDDQGRPVGTTTDVEYVWTLN